MDPILRASLTVDVDTLHNNIWAALPKDPVFSTHKNDPPESWWTTSEDGLVHLDDRIYVPDSNDLRLRVLQRMHDHILSGHLGQNKTKKLV